MGHFWSPKSTQDGPSWAQDGSWNDNFWKQWMFTKSFKNPYKINKHDPKSGHKTAQDRPQTVPGRSCRGVFFVSFFALIFDWFLVRFWSALDPFWRPFGGPNRSILASIFMWFLHVVLRGSKRAPRGSKRRPRGPKRPPRGAQEAPRGLQEVPKRPQEASKSGQEQPRIAKHTHMFQWYQWCLLIFFLNPCKALIF